MNPLLPIFILVSGLIAIGFYGIMAKRNLLKILISLDLMETGVNVFLVSVGYIPGGTAPIMNGNYSSYVDPLPQALVLTAIVIGLSVTALALVFVMLYHRRYGTIELPEGGIMKW